VVVGIVADGGRGVSGCVAGATGGATSNCPNASVAVAPTNSEAITDARGKKLIRRFP
jgi:hypothetical protein